VFGFEDAAKSDYDPTNEKMDPRNAYGSATFGVVRPSDHPVAVVFTENIRDMYATAETCIAPSVPVEQAVRGTQAHEILHTLGLPDTATEDAALMCGNLKNQLPPPAAETITPMQKAQLRVRVMPQVTPAEASQLVDCPSPPRCR
jgi:hypothetical protein